MQATWILVADGARARLFCPSADGSSLTELEDFANPDGRAPGPEFSYDRPPRTMESMGGASHVIQPHTSLDEKIAQRFAHELGEVLERGRVDHRYERLIVAAPPHFLGVLKQAMGKQVEACMVAHLSKDLTTLPGEEIRARLATIDPQLTRQQAP